MPKSARALRPGTCPSGGVGPRYFTCGKLLFGKPIPRYIVPVIEGKPGKRMAEDASYYERRMQQERAAAEAAPCAHTRRVHEEMAELYSKMLKVLGSAANDPD